MFFVGFRLLVVFYSLSWSNMIDINEKVQNVLNEKSNWRTTSPDEPPCAMCNKIIEDDVPIRLWSDDGNLEISFHPNCFFEE